MLSKLNRLGTSKIDNFDFEYEASCGKQPKRFVTVHTVKPQENNILKVGPSLATKLDFNFVGTFLKAVKLGSLS